MCFQVLVAQIINIYIYIYIQWYYLWAYQIYSWHRSSRLEVFYTKRVIRNFAKLSGKHLSQSHFFNKVARLRPTTLLKKRLWRRCFSVKFEKFLRTPFCYRTPLVASLEWCFHILNKESIKLSQFFDSSCISLSFFFYCLLLHSLL